MLLRLLVWALPHVLALAPLGLQAQPLDLTLPDPIADEPTYEGDSVVLPSIIVKPSEEDLWTWGARNMHRLDRSLPALGTDGHRTKDFSEKLLEGLGLVGDGVLALHPSDQQRISDLLDKLEGGDR